MTALRQLVLWLLALALLLTPLVAVFNGWIASERWPLQRLVIEAEFRQIDELRVRDVVLPHLNRGFFAVRPEQIRQALMTLPWVSQAEVRKRWPDVLELRLDEHRAYARWGEDRLLSRDGVLFEAGQSPEAGQLPLLEGPDDRLAEVVRVYRKSASLLSASGLSVRAVRLSPRGSWSLRLDDGSELLLGRAEVEARLERYSKVLPQLREPTALPILRADLRYANGFALLWAKPGIGNGESGIERARLQATAYTACIPALRAAPGCPTPAFPTPAFPIVDSPFPIPGSTT